MKWRIDLSLQQFPANEIIAVFVFCVKFSWKCDSTKAIYVILKLFWTVNMKQTLNCLSALVEILGILRQPLPSSDKSFTFGYSQKAAGTLMSLQPPHQPCSIALFPVNYWSTSGKKKNSNKNKQTKKTCRVYFLFFAATFGGKLNSIPGGRRTKIGQNSSFPSHLTICYFL